MSARSFALHSVHAQLYSFFHDNEPCYNAIKEQISRFRNFTITGQLVNAERCVMMGPDCTTIIVLPSGFRNPGYEVTYFTSHSELPSDFNKQKNDYHFLNNSIYTSIIE